MDRCALNETNHGKLQLIRYHENSHSGQEWKTQMDYRKLFGSELSSLWSLPRQFLSKIDSGSYSIL